MMVEGSGFRVKLQMVTSNTFRSALACAGAFP